MQNSSTLNRIRLGLAGMALSAGAVLLFYLEIISLNTPNETLWPVKGIDLSHHQGQVDFAELKRAEPDLSFVYLKATEGGDWTDDHFAKNWRESRAQGFFTGAYHFFTPCRSGKTQAKNFMHRVPVEMDALPPVADAERMEKCVSPDADVKSVPFELLSLLKEMETHYAKTPVLYVTHAFYEKYVMEDPAFSKFPLWIREVWEEPQLSNGRKWMFWQYSNRGRVAGIEGRVDRNVFAGTLEELADL